MDVFDFHTKQAATENKTERQRGVSQIPIAYALGNEKKRIFIFGKHSMDKNIAPIKENILLKNKKNSFAVI